MTTNLNLSLTVISIFLQLENFCHSHNSRNLSFQIVMNFRGRKNDAKSNNIH